MNTLNARTVFSLDSIRQEIRTLDMLPFGSKITHSLVAAVCYAVVQVCETPSECVSLEPRQMRYLLSAYSVAMKGMYKKLSVADREAMLASLAVALVQTETTQEVK